MSVIRSVLLPTLLLELGCATVQERNLATAYDAHGRHTKGGVTPSGLVISSAEVEEYASEQFGLVTVTFENRTRQWRHLDSLSIDFGDPRRDGAVSLPWGADLESWAIAAEQKRMLERINTTNLLTLLMIGGSISASLAERDSTAQRMGGTVAAVAASATILNGMAKSSRPFFPSSHLLSGPISVPPGLFAKRWIVIQTPGDKSVGCVSQMNVSYQVEERDLERVTLVLRDSLSYSRWQEAACDSKPAPQQRRRR